jgi:hypothetical protein
MFQKIGRLNSYTNIELQVLFLAIKKSHANNQYEYSIKDFNIKKITEHNELVRKNAYQKERGESNPALPGNNEEALFL